jgi:hypothetical protein
MRLFLILLIALCGSLHAREVVVTSEGASQAAVARLQAQIEPAFEHIYAKTSLHDDEPVHLLIVGGSSRFMRIAQADGVTMDAESVLGYAMPSRRRVVLNLSGIAERGLEPIGVLRHELAHLVMGSQLRVQRPLWFEEGVCQYVESVAINALRESAGVPSMATFDSLDSLSAGLRHDGLAGAAYAESRETVRLLVSRHGEDAFFRLMGLLQRGDVSFEAAFEHALGETIPAFEAVWLEDQKSRRASRAAMYVGGMFGLILLGLAGAVLPLVWLLRRRRGKSQVDIWEEQEKYFPSDPSWSYAEDDESWRG